MTVNIGHPIGHPVGSVLGSLLGLGGQTFSILLSETFYSSVSLGSNAIFSRDTIGTILDFEGNIKEVPVNCPRFNFGRFVWNRVETLDLSSSEYSAFNCTVIDTGTTEIIDNHIVPVYRINISANGAYLREIITVSDGDKKKYINSIFLKNASITGTVKLRNPDITLTPDVTSDVLTTIKRFCSDVTAANNATTCYLGLDFGGGCVDGDYIDACFPQLENVTGASNQSPSEPISVGVGTGPELFDDDYSDGVSIGNWVAWENNTVENDAGAIQCAYVDGVNGMQCLLRELDATSEDLKVGRSYEVKVTLKTTGALTFRIYDGAVWANFITNSSVASYTEYTKTITVVSSNNVNFLCASMGAGDVIWVKDITIKECDPGNLGVDGCKYFTTDNGNSVSSNVVTSGTGDKLNTEISLLMEPQTTNKQQQPTDFTQWTNTGSTDSLQSNGFTRITDTAASSNHYVYRACTGLTASTPHTVSALVKKGNLSYCYLIGSSAGVSRAYFNLTDGTVETRTGSGDISSSIEEVDTDTYLISLTYTSVGTTDNVYFGLAAEDNVNIYLGDAAGYADIRYANITESDVAMSGILTNGASTTRNADTLSYTLDIDQDKGTSIVSIAPSYTDFNAGCDLIGTDILFTGSAADSLSINDGSTTDSATYTGGDLDSARFVTSSLWETSVKQVGYSDGSWTWSAEGTYDGSLLETTTIYICEDIEMPVRIKELSFYMGNPGTEWIENNTTTSLIFTGGTYT